MKSRAPLVTIGIPTYNRAEMLRRSIESALCQDYPMIEVVISDNASVDETHDICQEFSKKDVRVKYVRHSSNLGPIANFTSLLEKASGEYFMWLGDDDWLDISYVSHCMSLLSVNPDVALVSGTPIYYRSGLKSHAGRLLNLMESSWVVRVAHYYMMVADNGMFYGVMRTAQLQPIVTPKTMGGDWHLIANIISMGKARMSPVVSVHRELGGATASYRHITDSLGLPPIQAVFPMTSIALGACENIIFTGVAYKKHSLIVRIFLAGIVFVLVIAKPTYGYLGRVRRLVKRIFAL